MKCRTTLRGAAALALATALLASWAPGALAAQTLGQTGTAVFCDDNTSYFQRSVELGSDYAASAPGVITSYSTVSGASPKSRKLMVFEDQGSNNYKVKAKDIVRTPTMASVLNVFIGLHVSIAAGQRIGYFIPDQAVDGGDCLTFGVTPNGAPDDEYRHAAGEPALEVPTGFGAFATGGRVNLAATVEPDADGDAYGDETQDGCPGNGAVTGACPVATPSAPTVTTTDNAAARAAAIKRCKKKRTPLARRKCIKRAKKKFA